MKATMSFIASFIFFINGIMPVFAETPKQFLDERTDSEKYSYLYGSLETAMIMNREMGHPEKSACIKDWFAGNADEANKELMGAIHQVKDKDFPVAAVILILIDRHCDDADATNAKN